MSTYSHPLDPNNEKWIIGQNYSDTCTETCDSIGGTCINITEAGAIGATGDDGVGLNPRLDSRTACPESLQGR